MAKGRVTRGKKQEQQRQRWGQIAIGLILVFLMVASILQFGGGNQNTDLRITFNDIKFERYQEYYKAEINDQEQLFHHAPLEGNLSKLLLQGAYGSLIQLDASNEVAPMLQQATFVAFTFDPEVPQELAPLFDLMRLEMSQQLGNVYSGMLYNSTAYQLPIINCTSATAEAPVITFLLGNMTNAANITIEGNCLTVRGDPPGLLAAKDFLVLAVEGVIPRG